MKTSDARESGSGPSYYRLWGGRLAGVFLVWVMVFSLPWHWPVRGPVDSQSYVFGFNNTAAQLGLAVCLLVFFLARNRWEKIRLADQALFRKVFFRSAKAPKIPFWPLAICLAASVGVVGGYWLWLPFSYYGEATYFLTRLDMITLGFLPFRQFNFGYGPAMVWVPYFLHQISWGWLPTDSAYLLTHLSFYVFGILTLHSILKNFDLSAGHYTALLLLGTFASLNLMMGIQYAPLRFFFPLWAALTLHAQLQGSPLRAWIAALGLPFLGFMIGPEIGLITVVAAVVGILRQGLGGRPELLRYSLAPLSVLALPFLLFGQNYFKMIFFFGGGAGNFPLLPAPYVIALLCVACWLLPRLAVASGRQAQSQAGVCISVLFALGMFMPAALGRCDPGHVLHNGLGIFLFGLISVIRIGGGKRLAAAYLFFLIALATDKVSFWNHYQDSLASAQATKQALQAHQAELAKGNQMVLSRLLPSADPPPLAWGKQLPFSPDLLALSPYSKIAVPRGMTEDLDRFLKVSGRYFPEYYVPPYDGTFTPAALEEKLHGLRGAQALLIPENYLQQRQGTDSGAYAEGWSSFLSKLFLFPVRITAKNHPFEQELILVNFVENHFRPVGKFRNFLVMQPK